MKKLLNKKNNKGFSLVELIVVVLIMGIIAVALAPQVMKWVGSSKITTDKNNADAIKSSVQTALADWQGRGNVIPKTGSDFAATINGGITCSQDWTGTGTTASLKAVLDEVTAADYPKSQYDNTGFTVDIDVSTGKVTIGYSAKNVTP